MNVSELHYYHSRRVCGRQEVDALGGDGNKATYPETWSLPTLDWQQPGGEPPSSAALQTLADAPQTTSSSMSARTEAVFNSGQSHTYWLGYRVLIPISEAFT